MLAMAKVIRYTKYGYEIYDTETMSYKMLDSSYTHVSNFVDGFAKIAIGHSYGYINEQGEEVIPAIYSDISDVYNGRVFTSKVIFNLKDGTSSSYVSGYGQDIFLGKGMITTQPPSSYEWWRCKHHHYKMNNNGVLEPFLNGDVNREIRFRSNYSNNCALASERTWEIAENHGRRGDRYMNGKNSLVIIDEEGNVICRLHKHLSGFIGDHMNWANVEFGKFTHIYDTIYKFDIKGYHKYLDLFINIATDDNIEYHGDYSYCDPIEFNGLRRICKRGKWGYINKDNIEVIPCEYDRACAFVDNIAKVVGGCWLGPHYIDIYGKIVSEPPILHNLQYRQDLATFDVGNIKATIDRGLRNYCRYQNVELYIPGFVAVDNFIKGIAIAVDFNKKCGVIDVGGNKLSEFIYDNIYDDGEFLKTHIGKKSELFCSFKVWGAKRTCVDGNKYGYLSRNGEVLIKCEYDYLSQIKDGIARGYKDGELHIINIKLNKISYYALDNWLTDIGLIAEQYLMPMDNHKDEFSFLSQQYKCKIIEGIKSCKWRDYFITLSEVVGDYVEHLNISDILKNYKIELVDYCTCRRGDKDDDAITYLTSKLENTEDVYLNELLSYSKVLYKDRGYSAGLWFWDWQRTEEYKTARDSTPSLTRNKKRYFRRHYTKDKHKRFLMKYIHNKLKETAITRETDCWVLPYVDALGLRDSRFGLFLDRL